MTGLLQSLIASLLAVLVELGLRELFRRLRPAQDPSAERAVSLAQA